MGTFCTTSALDAAMVGTTFDEATTNLADECVDWAEQDIRLALSDRYDLSSAYFNEFPSVPPMVRTMCERRAIGYMYEQMSRGSKEAHARADRYLKSTDKWLEKLSMGPMDLYDTTGSKIATRSTANLIKSSTENYHNTFDERNPLNWHVDEDKIQDLSDEKD